MTLSTKKSLYQITKRGANIKIGVAEEEFKASIALGSVDAAVQISEGLTCCTVRAYNLQ